MVCRHSTHGWLKVGARMGNGSSSLNRGKPVEGIHGQQGNQGPSMPSKPRASPPCQIAENHRHQCGQQTRCQEHAQPGHAPANHGRTFNLEVQLQQGRLTHQGIWFAQNGSALEKSLRFPTSFDFSNGILNSSFAPLLPRPPQ